MEFVTQNYLRTLLREKLGDGTQTALAKQINVKPQNLSQMLNGARINGRVLHWLGYKAVDDLYVPLKPQRNGKGK